MSRLMSQTTKDGKGLGTSKRPFSVYYMSTKPSQVCSSNYCIKIKVNLKLWAIACFELCLEEGLYTDFVIGTSNPSQFHSTRSSLLTRRGLCSSRNQITARRNENPGNAHKGVTGPVPARQRPTYNCRPPGLKTFTKFSSSLFPSHLEIRHPWD